MPGDITYAVRCYVDGKERDTYIVTPLPSAKTLFNTLAQVDAEDQWFDTVKLIEREELAPRSSDTSRVRYHNKVIAYWSSREGVDGD